LNAIYSGDGNTIIGASQDGQIISYDSNGNNSSAHGKVISKVQAHYKPIRTIAFDNENNTVYSGSDDQRINLIDIRNGQIISSFGGHNSWVLAIEISPDKKHFATASADKKIKVWDLAKRECVYQWENAHSNSIWGLQYNAAGNILASCSDSGTIKFHEVANN